MTNRRQFLGLGLAASVWPVVAPATASRSAREALGSPGIYKAVFDTRAAAGRRFAARMRACGVPARGISGDVTRVWYEDLALRWREAPAAIAGVTAPDTLFCLEQLAWDHRMRVVFRAERVVAADGATELRLEGPEHVLASAAGLGGSRLAEAEALAELAVQCPRAALVPEPRSTRRVPARRGVHDSWVAWAIAPVRRA